MEDREQIDLSRLYSSRSCTVTDILVTGKKQIAGVIRLKGKPSVYGSGTEVRALKDGLVMYAGRSYDQGSRMRFRGTHVSVLCEGNVVISYERLANIRVQEGDKIKAGEIIGDEGNSGADRRNRYLQLRFTRCGRLIDGRDYLGMPLATKAYRNNDMAPEEAVCKLCKLDSRERVEIRSLPCANTIWEKIMNGLYQAMDNSQP